MEKTTKEKTTIDKTTMDKTTFISNKEKLTYKYGQPKKILTLGGSKLQSRVRQKYGPTQQQCVQNKNRFLSYFLWTFLLWRYLAAFLFC